ncbi:hypothetical protein EDD80_101305 [Anseongella ginsenosidimutans]|uniref:Uncharacterized protein n=1 Tax=Anseongella ginsenosidimutans TaxID=496056 RepID=A0A4R3KWF4_9SPHI|nr:hypothetical protein EDD80_101305 [Anseongella ginsenosidimutans]
MSLNKTEGGHKTLSRGNKGNHINKGPHAPTRPFQKRPGEKRPGKPTLGFPGSPGRGFLFGNIQEVQERVQLIQEVRHFIMEALAE